jgi:hypothetical protein
MTSTASYQQSFMGVSIVMGYPKSMFFLRENPKEIAG